VNFDAFIENSCSSAKPQITEFSRPNWAVFLGAGQYTSEQCQRLMAEYGVVCSLSRSGNVWDNAAMESFFSSLKTERKASKTYRTRDEARADVFDYIERFYNPRRRHSTLGYLSPVDFEAKMRLA
jgi:putative transposase